MEERIRARGFEGVSAFLHGNSGLSYGELAQLLAQGDDVASIQLERLHAEIAEEDQQARKAAVRDSLTRFLRGALRTGWGHGKYWESRVGSALASWTVTWGGGDELQRVKKALFSLRPPPGWIPGPEDDPILAQAFDLGWPERPA